MPRKKKERPPKPYPSRPGERGLLLRWWRDADAPLRGDRDAEEEQELAEGTPAAREAR